MNETRKAACPTCGKPTQYEWRPFCSKRCREVDLGRWLNERYVVPTPIAPDEEESIPDDGEP